LIDSSWKKISYKGNPLVTNVELKNNGIMLELKVEDAVHYFHHIFIRRATIKNRKGEEREVRLFFSHDLHISETDKDITAYYDPNVEVVIHFKEDGKHF
jgi:GH15 family glucan-1,4-alpha-glucosidase